MNDKPARHPTEWFRRLYDTEQWERLLTATGETLADYPNALDAHHFRAWALIDLDRLPEAKVHVDYLMADDPEDIWHLHLAAVWHLDSGEVNEAGRLISQAIRQDPNRAFLYHSAALIAHEAGEAETAATCATRARKLSPNSSAMARLDIVLSNPEDSSTEETWNKIRQLQEALALNPEDHDILASIGHFFLTHLEQPREAEKYYRQALMLAPNSKKLQMRLWEALQQRSLLFRTLHLPLAAARRLRDPWFQLQVNPGCIFALALAFNIGLGHLAWLAVSFVILGPPALFYQWLVLMDLRRASHLSGTVGYLTRLITGLSFPLRFTLGITVIVGFWCWILILCGVRNLQAWLLAFGIFFALHFLYVLLSVGYRGIHSHLGRRKADRTRADRQRLPLGE